jgi:hypothetical protein
LSEEEQLKKIVGMGPTTNGGEKLAASIMTPIV